MLVSLPVHEYATQLASQSSTPGGGSAAALAGLLGVSLIEMSLNLTIGKPQYAEHEEFLATRQKALARVHTELTQLIDRDAAAFGAVMAAYKLPKGIEEEKAVRHETIQKTLREAADVPLAIARFSLESLEIGKSLVDKINKQVISDLAVGAQLSQAAVSGALLNTAINLPLLADESLASAMEGQILLLRTAAEDLLAYIQREIYSQEPFTVMQTAE